MDRHSIRSESLETRDSFARSTVGSFRAAALFRPPEVGFSVHPHRVLLVMVAIIAALAVASTLAAGLLYIFGWSEGTFQHDMVKLFWLDTEYNVPTLYQCMAMLAASALFFLLGVRYRRKQVPAAYGWFVFSVAFAFLAFDEGARVHETIGLHFGTTFGGSWLYFYLPAAAALVVAIVPLLRRLPTGTLCLLILSGMLYVGGAAGIEIVQQLFAEPFGRTSPIYGALGTIEEVLEMLGVALLVFTLLAHLGQLAPGGGNEAPRQ